MRKIYIDQQLKDQADDFCKTLFQRKDKRMQQVVPRLEKLRDKLRPRKDKAYREYLELLIKEYDKILKATPSEMVVWKNKFERILDPALLTAKVPNKKKAFHESVVHMLRYSDLQSYEYQVYMAKSPNRACVYCNAQLSLIIDVTYFDYQKRKKVNKTRPLFEIDHFYPKSKHPYFATSFFNLYPCCGNCNRAKSDNQVLFELYSENPDKLDVFEFVIDDGDVIDYFDDHQDVEQVKVTFSTIEDNDKLLQNHNQYFGVQGIADLEKGLLEELLLKSKLYTTAYKESLVQSLESIFPDTEIIDRLLLGNYTDPEDVHRRPMAKFTQDIAQKLNLLDNTQDE